MNSYIALLRKENASDYGVEFPDFPGCITAGKTLDEAKSLAKEALDLHIEGMIDDGEELPAPSSLDKIMADTSNQEAVAFLVTPSSFKQRTVRINITLDKAICEDATRYAESHGMSRSGLIAEALRSTIY